MKVEHLRCTVPVLLLVFNRPEHTRAALQGLRAVRPSNLYIHCDGARPAVAGEAEKVAAVRAIVQEIDWDCRVQTLFRERNFGLRAGVMGALNWFFQQEEYGVVLEDDCRPDPSFFPFCAELLERYRDDPQVMHIGGSNLLEDQTKDLPSSYFFSRFSFVWGWAGWRRAWEKMSPELAGLEEFVQKRNIRELTVDPMAQAYMLDKFNITRLGKNKSWAYAWFYSILKNNGLCIVPSINLVQNVGVGEEGATNTTGRNEAARRVASPVKFPLTPPTARTPMPRLERAFFYISQKRRVRLWLWYVLHKLGLR